MNPMDDIGDIYPLSPRDNAYQSLGRVEICPEALDVVISEYTSILRDLSRLTSEFPGRLRVGLAGRRGASSPRMYSPPVTPPISPRVHSYPMSPISPSLENVALPIEPAPIEEVGSGKLLQHAESNTRHDIPGSERDSRVEMLAGLDLDLTMGTPAASPGSKKKSTENRAKSRHTQHDVKLLEAARQRHEQNQSVREPDLERRESERRRKCQCLARVVESNHFELFMAVVIISNSFFIGLQVEYNTSQRTNETTTTFYIIQYIYAFIFTAELVVRLMAGGLRKFFSCNAESVYWNYLDAFVVASTLFEVVFDTLNLTAQNLNSNASGIDTSGAQNVRIVRILRIARLLRIIRIARVLRYLHALRTFILSIFATLKSLVWALILLFMIVYLFAILFTQAAGDWLIDEVDSDTNESPVEMSGILRYWGSLPRSMLTLYKSISGGVSWDDVVHPAAQFGWVWVGVFLLYISFTYFAVLNVVTGIFCQSAIESAQQNEDLMVQAQIASKELYIGRIKRLFSELDEDSSGSITITELEEHLSDERVQATFASIDIDSKDAWTLFKMLARDTECEITAEDFVEGLMRLKGNAKRADFVELHVLIKRLDLTSHDLVLMIGNLSQKIAKDMAFLVAQWESAGASASMPGNERSYRTSNHMRLQSVSRGSGVTWTGSLANTKGPKMGVRSTCTSDHASTKVGD